jgi:hypothetical protein
MSVNPNFSSLSLVSNFNMTFSKWAVRVAGVIGIVVVSFVVIAFLAVQIQQRMLRWHAERLLADMHQIRLYQSTWTDAQRLMHRWGAWGHYDGTCTAASCKYEIEMDNIAWYNPRVPRRAWLDWLLRHDRFNLYEWFGGRGSTVRASFTVHDGTIWRESIAMGISVPTKKMRGEDDWEWSLSVGAGSSQRLNSVWGGSFIADSEDELAQHPYYKVGRPGGCEVLCQIVSVSFSTHTPPAEIGRLTSFDFSCFTRFSPCMHIADLLPAAEEWHLYDREYESNPTVPFPKELPLTEYSAPKLPPCSNIPTWAMARDARYVLAVEALSAKIEPGEYPRQVEKVRVVSSLKEPAPWRPGELRDAEESRWGEPEHMVPGRRYIMFPDDQRATKESPILFERCGVQEDTPEVRSELEKGFAQNDTLRP